MTPNPLPNSFFYEYKPLIYTVFISILLITALSQMTVYLQEEARANRAQELNMAAKGFCREQLPGVNEWRYSPCLKKEF